jgi:ferric-dicitrate binding protein FerR (iron transport regulator)
VFDVTANPASPFVVNAPGVKVKVLGTVFHVSSFLEDGPAETVLAEGSVELYNSEGNYLVTLSPSQKAVYDSGTLQVKEVKVDDMAMMRYGLRIIRDASLQEIIRTIESEFNVRLHAVSYNSKDALFTISYIKDAKISDILDMVETVSGSKFEIQD